MRSNTGQYQDPRSWLCWWCCHRIWISGVSSGGSWWRYQRGEALESGGLFGPRSRTWDSTRTYCRYVWRRHFNQIFTYLGSVVHDSELSYQEVSRRIGLVGAMNSLDRSIWKWQCVYRRTKLSLRPWCCQFCNMARTWNRGLTPFVTGPYTVPLFEEDAANRVSTTDNHGWRKSVRWPKLSALSLCSLDTHLFGIIFHDFLKLYQFYLTFRDLILFVQLVYVYMQFFIFHFGC